MPARGQDAGLEAYRREARAWLAGNLRPREGPDPDRGVDHYTPGVMAANRVLQRQLFEAGYAGITWPREYGGQGLPAAYEWAFVDEAAGYVLPDFGALTITTFYVCVPTMLAHAPPGFLRGFVPRVLAGEELVCNSSRSRRPDPTWPALGHGPPGTAINGSSTARRYGAPSPTSPTRGCALPAPTPLSPSTRA